MIFSLKAGRYRGGYAMNSDKIDMYLISNNQFFPADKMPIIKEKLMLLPDEKFSQLYALELKDPTNILLFSIFLGEFGVDRFLVGDIVLGILKLITLGGCLVWWFIDLFLIRDRARAVNYEKLMELLSQTTINSLSTTRV